LICQHLLNHQRVDVYQRNLQQMQGEHGQCLILEPVRGDFTAFAKEDEVIRVVP
jgi:hypothetical protein